MIDWKDFENLIQWSELNKTKKIEEPTFFEIAGFPHYEIVISNFYHYYFDLSQPHGFEDLFITSLLNLINQKYAKNEGFDFNNRLFTSHREVRTNKGNLIDILLLEGEENDKPNFRDNFDESKSAIIIENKMYADVYNDLNDYYDFVKCGNKIGVVLTLKSIKLQNNKYVCITHNELLNEVTRQSLNYLLSVSERQIAIFKDFIRNLQSFYRNQQMELEIEKHIDFFFNNGNKVKQLFEEYNNFLLYLNKTIEQVALSLHFDLMTKRSSAKKTSVFGIEASSIGWWIYLEDIVYGKTFTIDLWIQQNNSAVNHWKSLSEVELKKYLELAQSSSISVKTSSGSNDRNIWRKIGSKVYNVTFNDLNDFENYFKNIFVKDWLPLRDEILELQKINKTIIS
ncbi:PD-(D/E)XK nuclease family protein [Emticicia agri]|uniref:PD-(D/E)XK nuclease superfamily protein n=1 Tax=Emticicia agri TaxID=2492393 RepID=A0A4Q5M581_9BACT|nr:PD-(D/E)XK nuclease family protein [Emticicia agri]RYU97073.1 hypothetical protein EWM59_03965 [Emticicia agri]